MKQYELIILEKKNTICAFVFEQTSNIDIKNSLVVDSFVDCPIDSNKH